MKENYIGNTQSAVNSEPSIYTQRRLEDETEEIAKKWHDGSVSYGKSVKSLKTLLSTSIQQAIAEDRERVRGIIGSPEWLENHHCENNDGSSVCNCFKEALNTLLFSLDKPVNKKD